MRRCWKREIRYSRSDEQKPGSLRSHHHLRSLLSPVPFPPKPPLLTSRSNAPASLLASSTTPIDPQTANRRIPQRNYLPTKPPLIEREPASSKPSTLEQVPPASQPQQAQRLPPPNLACSLPPQLEAGRDSNATLIIPVCTVAWGNPGLRAKVAGALRWWWWWWGFVAGELGVAYPIQNRTPLFYTHRLSRQISRFFPLATLSRNTCSHIKALLLASKYQGL